MRAISFGQNPQWRVGVVVPLLMAAALGPAAPAAGARSPFTHRPLDPPPVVRTHVVIESVTGAATGRCA
jgi:hypothetical protein